jgi:DNA polymerase-3 subunit gamma/tau
MTDHGLGEHKVLALKWRPRRLADIVGQDHVVRTLTNALTQGKVSHAYLFTGPRGVGKTTTARILARAVNCEKGLGPDPCGECSNCRDAMAGRSLDVIEIDAASTGKVDDVRDLREIVRLAPARSRKKVFIIDEAHELTAGASNALLKTLEEPPPHVMFILATTDAQDLIPTIHSRCQRFDFHPLGPATIIGHLKMISGVEKIKVDDDALALIAKAANGAMRDAQMLLEQAASYVTGTLTAAEMRGLLGLVEREWVEKFLNILHDRDIKGAMALLDDLIEAGRAPLELLEEVQEELRDALMRKLGADTAPMGTVSYLDSPERKEWFGEEELLALLAHTRRSVEELSMRNIAHPRVAAELAVARLMRRERALSWAEVEAALARVEGAPGVSAPAGAGETPSFRGGSAPIGRDPAPVFGDRSKPPMAGGPAPAHPPVVRVAYNSAHPETSQAAPAPQKVGEPAHPAATDRQAPAPGLKDAIRNWPDIIARVREANNMAFMYLNVARPVAVDGAKLTLEMAPGFQYDGLQRGDARANVEAVLGRLLGGTVVVVVKAVEAPARPVTPPAPSPAAGGTPDWVEKEPVVKAAMKIFRARIADVKKPVQGK